jgi:hypothetical protein
MEKIAPRRVVKFQVRVVAQTFDSVKIFSAHLAGAAGGA